MAYNIGVCDDEVLQVKVNGLYITELAKKDKIEINIKGFTSPKKLATYLENNKLDILFLDIDMGDESGITLAARLIEKNPDLIIIFVTGHREFAMDAFDVEAVGFIVKPVQVDKIHRALKKALLQVDAIASRKPASSFVITEDNLKKKIFQSDIEFIERQQTKSIIYEKAKEYSVYESITSLHERLDDFFLRVSQSCIVNMNEIVDIRDKKVFLKNGMDIQIGRTYLKDVKHIYYEFPRA